MSEIHQGQVMVKIIYIESDGTEHVINAISGRSIMENAVKNAIPGIVAECGGSRVCGTCRIYVDAEEHSKMKDPEAGELEILEFVGDHAPGVRLSCQIKVTENMDGLSVRMPEKQYS
jgi:2Fe-2S ferredoxin